MAEDLSSSQNSPTTIYTPDRCYGSPPMSPHLSDFAQFSDMEDVEDGAISSEYAHSDAEGPPCEKRKFDEYMDSPVILIDHGDKEPSSMKFKTTILDYFKPKLTATSNNAFTLPMSSSQ